MRLIVKLFKPESVTVLTALILITPVCGALFACGCTWPGLGLETDCNYFNPQEPYHCPWCASFFAGTVSVIIAVLTGYVITKKYAGQEKDLGKSAMPIIAGLIGFLLLAFVTAWLSAILQHYPHFIVFHKAEP